MTTSKALPTCSVFSSPPDNLIMGSASWAPEWLLFGYLELVSVATNQIDTDVACVLSVSFPGKEGAYGFHRLHKISC